MDDPTESKKDDVQQIMLNAQLRDELEPFLDESVHLVNIRHMPTKMENEFLESMLAWERAPVLPISKWFEPELTLPHPESLGEEEISTVLWGTIHRLYDKRIVLEFTDHLSDRNLYCVLFRDILPSSEKKIDLPKNFLHWHCLDHSRDAETWLRYYASDEERDEWAHETGEMPPVVEVPPYPRKMPRRPR